MTTTWQSFSGAATTAAGAPRGSGWNPGPARTEQVVHEVAVVEHVPVDAQQMGLTDLTAPGLALASSLNPANRRQMRRARWFVGLYLLPVVVAILLAALS